MPDTVTSCSVLVPSLPFLSLSLGPECYSLCTLLILLRNEVETPTSHHSSWLEHRSDRGRAENSESPWAAPINQPICLSPSRLYSLSPCHLFPALVYSSGAANLSHSEYAQGGLAPPGSLPILCLGEAR